MTASAISRLDSVDGVGVSAAGYEFNLASDVWRLDKNTSVNVGKAKALIGNKDVANGYLCTIAFFAENSSTSHAQNINLRMIHFLREVGDSLSESSLINYKARLSKNTMWYLGVVRLFLAKWWELGYYGVSDEVEELLGEWVLPGNQKGDRVKRRDPINGPLTEIELLGFNEAAVAAYEAGDISIATLAIAMFASHTGRRPIQISHLKIKDMQSVPGEFGDEKYLVHVPRAKGREARFRGERKAVEVSKDLWDILQAQSISAVELVEERVGRLSAMERMELPLFPDIPQFSGEWSREMLLQSLQTDCLHLKSAAMTAACKKIVTITEVKSERTGEILNMHVYRLRSLFAMRAARFGYGPEVIAELLDHRDMQNVGVYVYDIPEHATQLDGAIGEQMSKYADAFLGRIVDSESDAKRGVDPASRIRIGRDGVGTCGDCNECGANVPVPCYTCIHFQPWVDGPHEQVLEDLMKSRTQMLKSPKQEFLATVLDRSILAVKRVITLCQQRRKSVTYG